MLRALNRIIIILTILMTGSAGIYLFIQHNSEAAKLAAAQELARQKQVVIDRLETDRRVAKILVKKQDASSGQVKTTLVFQEFRKDGSSLTPREFTIDGDEAHFDAEIVKFKDQYVESGDPLRGQSIVLFTRVYGADQAPENGFAIDEPGAIPQIYKGADSQASDFEQGIWKEFWTLFNDKEARDARGIRGLNGEGLWGHFLLNHEYLITLRDGGGTITESPLEGIYQSAMSDK